MRPVETLLRDGSAAARRRIAAATDGWTQRVGGYAGLPMLIQALGLEPVSTLAAAGLASNALADPEHRISYATLGHVLQLTAARSGCHHAGLLAGRLLQLSDLGLTGTLVRNCRTVGDALRTLTAQQHRDSEGGLAFLIDHGATAELGYAIYHPHVPGTDQIYDSVLAAHLHYLRELCGPGWVPREVLVPHAPRADVRAYRAQFRVHPRFNAEWCAVRFASDWLARKVPDADPAQRERARTALPPAPSADLMQQVFRAVQALLIQGRVSGDAVADALGINRRTLNRRLRAHGVTYQAVLDEIRFGLARQMLATSDISLDDVAANLGYAGAGPFARTFQRWAGKTPGRWRRSQLSRNGLLVAAE